MDMSLSELRELVMDREALHAVIHVVTKNQTQVSNWTEVLNEMMYMYYGTWFIVLTQKLLIWLILILREDRRVVEVKT